MTTVDFGSLDRYATGEDREQYLTWARCAVARANRRMGCGREIDSGSYAADDWVDPTLPYTIRARIAARSTIGGYKHTSPPRWSPAPSPAPPRPAPEPEPATLARVHGTACRFFDEAEVVIDGERFRESVERGAFRGSPQEVPLLLDHLSSRRVGTARLIHAVDGLRFTGVLFDTPLGRQALDDIRAGRLSGCSMGFRASADFYRERVDWRPRLRVVQRARVEELTLTEPGSAAFGETIICVTGPDCPIPIFDLGDD